MKEYKKNAPHIDAIRVHMTNIFVHKLDNCVRKWVRECWWALFGRWREAKTICLNMSIKIVVVFVYVYITVYFLSLLFFFYCTKRHRCYRRRHHSFSRTLETFTNIHCVCVHCTHHKRVCVQYIYSVLTSVLFTRSYARIHVCGDCASVWYGYNWLTLWKAYLDWFDLSLVLSCIFFFFYNPGNKFTYNRIF